MKMLHFVSERSILLGNLIQRLIFGPSGRKRTYLTFHKLRKNSFSSKYLDSNCDNNVKQGGRAA